MVLYANKMEAGVEDVAEGGQAGEREDRSKALVRAMKAADRFHRWEQLLEDIPRTVHSELETPRPTPVRSAVGCNAPIQMTSITNAPSGVDGEGLARRGMVRFVYLIVDMTDAARQPDYKPRRFEFAVEAAQRFAGRFLAENPLGELGLAVQRGGTCELVAPLGSIGEEFTQRLLEAASVGPRGRMSISNGLQRVMKALEGAPPHGSREALLLFASLSTCDAAECPLESLLPSLQERRVRVSVVSMSPELHVLKSISTQTGGSFAVALDSRHFDELLSSHVSAPAFAARALMPKLIRMGFPRRAAAPVLCTCHGRPLPSLYRCPQCDAHVCNIPTRCPLCELPLVSVPLISRSFRHLIPVTPFPRGVACKEDGSAPCGSGVCYGCHGPAQEGHRCPLCAKFFCDPCDDFVHKLFYP